MKIWVNTIVNNEENFIWFALMSVLDYVDKILVWGSGSTDKTVEIIKTIKSQKIEFKEVGLTDKFEFTKMRQKMLEQSKGDWILILDGDDIWWKDSIKKLVDCINKKGNNLDAIVNPFYNVLGDIYHYQSEEAGQYKLIGKKGHLTIRAINREISGLHVKGTYGQEGFWDLNNQPIQQRDSNKIAFLEAPFLHLTHLKRSSIDNHGKYKYELGIPFPEDFKYPEVFRRKRPNFVYNPLTKRSKFYEFIAIIVSPFLNLKRKFLK